MLRTTVDENWYLNKKLERKKRREQKIKENISKMLQDNDINREKREGSLLNFWRNLFKLGEKK